MIDVTNVDMVKFVQKVYDLSRPQGMGVMHFQPGGLSDADATALIQDDGTVSMDYIQGRACKMHVRSEDGKLTISDSWYDHTDDQLLSLLRHVGVCAVTSKDHGCSCNCDECRTKQGKGEYDPIGSLVED